MPLAPRRPGRDHPRGHQDMLDKPGIDSEVWPPFRAARDRCPGHSSTSSPVHGNPTPSCSPSAPRAGNSSAVSGSAGRRCAGRPGSARQGSMTSGTRSRVRVHAQVGGRPRRLGGGQSRGLKHRPRSASVPRKPGAVWSSATAGRMNDIATRYQWMALDGVFSDS